MIQKLSFLLPSLILCFLEIGSCQSFELFGGLNRNRLFDTNGADYVSREYHSGTGVDIGFGCVDKFDVVRLEVVYQLVQGELTISSGGRGGSNTLTAKIESHHLNISVYAFPIRLTKFKILVNLGMQLGISLFENNSGFVSYQNYLGGGSIMDIKDREGTLNNDATIGGIIAVGRQISLGNGWFLYPRYSFYYGLTPLLNTRVNTKVQQHKVLIGIIKELTKVDN